MPKKIKIKNTLPDILSALCSHKDCSDWLKTTIWNKLNDNADIPTDSPEQYALMLKFQKREPELKS